MNSKVLSIIIAILVFIAGWLSSAGISVKEIKLPFIDTNKGRLILFIGISIIIILLGIGQSELIEIESKEQLAIHDSIQHLRFDRSISKLINQSDSNYKQTMIVISDTLGKYGFKFDLAQKRVEKLILDSSKLMIINDKDPTITIGYVEYNKVGTNSYKLSITINFRVATSANHDLNIYLAAIDSVTGVWEYLGKVQKLKFRNFMIDGDWGNFESDIDGSKVNRIGEFLLYFTGLYSNSDNTKKFSLNEYYSFNVNTKGLGMPSEINRKKFIKYLNAYNNFNLPVE